MTKCAGAILAGGKSSRMGHDKARLSFHDTTMLGFLEGVFQSSDVEQIYVSRANSIADIIPDCGPLGGIHAVLKTDDMKHDYIIFAVIDMPGLTPEILNTLINAPEDADLVFFGSYKFPFRVRVKKNLSALLENLLREKSNLSVGHFQGLFENKLVLDPPATDQHAFININTPQDWHDFKERIEQ